MKLNNYLINTLPDFARHFTFIEFWEKRRQFVRDMHPSKVYYWNEDLKDAYNNIATWICEGGNASDIVKKNGIYALETIINRKIDREEIFVCDGEIDTTSAIIRVKAGTTLELPKYETGTINNTEINLCFHKIEVYGHSNMPAVIRIGTQESIELFATDFTYVTEVNNKFIELMPTHLENDVFKLHLTSEEGVFSSTLNVRKRTSGDQIPHNGVISFALTNNGYIYIDANCKPILMTDNSSELRYMLNYAGKAFYVKAKDEQVIILYQDGTLKSTSGNIITNKVVYAGV